MNTDERHSNQPIKEINPDQVTWHDLLKEMPEPEIPQTIDQLILQAATQNTKQAKPQQQTSTKYTFWQRWVITFKKPWFSSLFAGGLAASVATVVWLKQPDPLSGLPKVESAEIAKTSDATKSTPVLDNQKNEVVSNAPSAASVPSVSVAAGATDSTPKPTAETRAPAPQTTAKPDSANSKQELSKEIKPNSTKSTASHQQTTERVADQTGKTTDISHHSSPTSVSQKDKGASEKAEVNGKSAQMDHAPRPQNAKGALAAAPSVASPAASQSPAPSNAVTGTTSDATTPDSDTKATQETSPAQSQSHEKNSAKKTSRSSPSVVNSKTNHSSANKEEMPSINPKSASAPQKYGEQEITNQRPKEDSSESKPKLNSGLGKEDASQCFLEIEVQIKKATNDPYKIKGDIANCQRKYPNTRLSSTIQQFLAEHP